MAVSKKKQYDKKSDTGIINPDNITDEATQYAKDVIEGRVIAGWQVIASAKRHIQNLEDITTGRRTDIRYNLFEVNKVLKFLKKCSHYKTHIGKPFIPEAWQVFIIANLYGFEKWSDEANRWVFKHTDNFIVVGKKNGKSTLISGFAAYDCIFGESTGAEIYIGAATEDQAKIIWNSTKAFIDRNEILSHAYTTIGNTIYANNTDRTSFIKPFGRDSKKEGLNPYRVYIDELHDHPDSEVYTTLSDGMVARQKRGCTVITTAGNDVYSFCKKQQDRYEQILKGVFDADNVFALIYAAPIEADITKVDTWRLANPALETVKSLEAMTEDYNKALQLNTLSIFRYKNLCQWVDDKEGWIDINKWNVLEAEEPELNGLKCYGGLDLAQVNDLCSFVLLFPKQDGLSTPFVKSFFWIPRKTARIKSLTDKIPFTDWEKQGHIFISNDEIIRLSDVASFIVEQSLKYDIKTIYYDRASAREVEAVLADNGIKAEPSFQGFGLSKDIKATENLIYAKDIRHDGNPCMNWNLSNAAVKLNDKQEKMLIKPIGYRKIDGCIALVESVGAMTVYENNLNNAATKRTNFTFRHTV